MSAFISGLDLNQRYYQEIVRPILDAEYPALRHAAARLGAGSEVLGYDDAISTDHDWGPHFQLFLSPADHQSFAAAITQTLRQKLPHTFLGYATNYAEPNHEGTRLLAPSDKGPVNHRVDVTTLSLFLRGYMAYDPAQPPTVYDWLAWPQQRLLGVTRGRLFVDELGLLEPLRRTLSYYPRDIWLYLLACQWARIGQEEHFVGRAGYVGDELGSRVMAARLVHDLMLLGFLMEKRYAPYPKWFGTGFAELACAPALAPLFQETLSAETWPKREKPLCEAYEYMARTHNQLGITEPIDPTVRSFHDRPFQVISADRFTFPIRDAIRDETVAGIVARAGLIGSIDQYSHSTDLRETTRLYARLQELYT